MKPLIYHDLEKCGYNQNDLKDFYYGKVLDIGSGYNEGKLSYYIELQTPDNRKQIIWSESFKNNDKLVIDASIVVGKLDINGAMEVVVLPVDGLINNGVPEYVNPLVDVDYNSEKVTILPGNSIISKVYLDELGLSRKAVKVIDSESKINWKKEIIAEDCKVILDALKIQYRTDKIFNISGTYVGSGVGLDPFYKSPSYYILLRTQEGKLKSIWGKELQQVVNAGKVEKSKMYSISKISGLNKYAVSQIGKDLSSRIGQRQRETGVNLL